MSGAPSTAFSKLMDIEYTALRYPRQPDNDICYLCGAPRNGEKSKDHVIPQKLFPAGCGNRPYLYVHDACNNGKSTDDKKFVYRMLVHCNRNTLAQSRMLDFVNKGNRDYVDAHLIGNKDPYLLRDYKLKNTITNQMSKRLDFMYGNQHMVEVNFTDEHVEFMKQYLKTMAQGLFLRNIPDAQLNMSHVIMLQQDFQMQDIRGLTTKLMQPIRNTAARAQTDGTLFTQSWKGIVEYFGGKANDEGTSGWVYIKFYDSYAAWVHFASEAEWADASRNPQLARALA